MQPVFEFIDYRKYLAAYYEGKKLTFPHFSYRYFSQKLGINSPSFLKHVIDGRRNLTPRMVERFSKALDHTVRESRYFRNLVLFNQAKTSGEKQEHYNVLRTMTGFVKEEVLGTDQFDYFSEWYTPVIRELVCMHDFKNDYAKIASFVNPPVKTADVRNSIALLLRLKLIELNSDGTYRQCSTALVADGTVTSLAVRSFTRSMLQLSISALEQFDKPERHVSGLTMGISEEAYKLLVDEIEAFKDRVKIIVNHDNGGTRVYQMNIGMFPVSQDLGGSVSPDGGEA